MIPLLDPSVSPVGAAASVRVEHHAGGARLVKELPPDAVDRLVFEAQVLEEARHPGVVELLGVDLRPVRPQLITAFVGSHTLETWAPTDSALVAGLFAALAETVADLHLSGLAHGRLTADHVVLDHAGRPRLCGFAHAVRVDASAPTARHDDVDAIGKLLDLVLERLEASPPRGGRRERRRSLRALRAVSADAQHPDGASRPSARRLAGAILDAVPEAQFAGTQFAGVPLGRFVHPTTVAPDPGTPEAATPHPARTSEPATASSEGVPAPEPPGPDTLTSPLPIALGTGSGTMPSASSVAPRPARVRHRRGATLAAGAVGAALIVMGVSTFGHGEQPTLAADTETPQTETPARTSSTGEANRETMATTAPAPPDHREPPTTTPSTTPAGDRPVGTRSPAPVPVTTPLPFTTPAPAQACQPPATCTRVSLDGTVERGGRHYAIGDPGDEIVVGDFRCRGVEAPVVLRPATGDIFTFDSWAANGHETTAIVQARTDAGAHLVPSEVDPAGCSRLLVILASGATVPVPLPAASGG